VGENVKIRNLNGELVLAREAETQRAQDRRQKKDKSRDLFFTSTSGRKQIAEGNQFKTCISGRCCQLAGFLDHRST